MALIKLKIVFMPALPIPTMLSIPKSRLYRKPINLPRKKPLTLTRNWTISTNILTALQNSRLLIKPDKSTYSFLCTLSYFSMPSYHDTFFHIKTIDWSPCQSIIFTLLFLLTYRKTYCNRIFIMKRSTPSKIYTILLLFKRINPSPQLDKIATIMHLFLFSN